MMSGEVYGQAGLIGDIYTSHLQKHKDNKPDHECEFCKAFILPLENKTGSPIVSYSFIILDVSDENTRI